MKRIMVIGGSGFLGKQICRIASLENSNIVSLSLGGKPPQVSDSEFKNVEWIAADIFRPDEWINHLQDCSAVIHCIGILEEQPEKGLTYERMIFTTAKIAAITAKANGIDKFVYISASAGAPDTPAGYMQNKIAAEEFLQSAELKLDLTILKPAMLYGNDRPETVEEYEYLKTLLDNPILRDDLYPNRPLPVEAVALFALKAAQGSIKAGTYGVDDIENYFLTTDKYYTQ
ncbi:NAD(P)H-binding protein [Elizabethkingia anophelis]|nr:NAD(P)H-binding protein [Elizabethkingia anophelis]MCT3659006.1 NAD(P)H-binding protein [Elizabethkingia anophelis]MCT3666171.1 NAD(P)H-binding protein [Elizabethkingia anophelis]MCT3852198.1 NAD(P)H-binding protein [Elizabethkingia anophelis]MCT3863015.1 NAD(P)H-binding protein [Elizabethkingia anophelis]